MAGVADLDIEELKSYVNIEGADHDVALQLQLDAAIEEFSHTGRRLTPLPANEADPPAAVTRRIDGSRWVRIPDAREVTLVTVDGVATDQWELRKNKATDPDDHPRPFLELLRGGLVCEVTGRFGFVEIPADMKDAIYSIAARRMYERESGFVDAIRTNAFGDRTYFKQFPAGVQAAWLRYAVAADRLGL